MNDIEVVEILKKKLGFTEFSINKLIKFHDYLLEYNKNYYNNIFKYFYYYYN